MIELPEAAALAYQINQTLIGKKIIRATANAHPLKFAWYSGDPNEYNQRLAGKMIRCAESVGGFVEIQAGDMILAISAPIHYHEANNGRPAKHQLLLDFEDNTSMSSSAQLWGGFYCFPAGRMNASADYEIATRCPSPLGIRFTRDYFQGLITENVLNLSVKEFLATEQRVPGLGNGVLQDICWGCKIHPRTKMKALPSEKLDELFDAVKDVLSAMTLLGGRDTETDLFANPGGYHTIVSAKTDGKPCPACGTILRKESYLGGSIHVCEECQPILK